MDNNEGEMSREEIEAKIEELMNHNEYLEYQTRNFQEPGEEQKLMDIAKQIDENNDKINKLKSMLGSKKM